MSEAGAFIVVGAGPGVGLAAARRFAAAGHPVGFVTRTETTAARLSGALSDVEVRVETAVADITETAALDSALTALQAALGPVEVVLFSPRPDVAWIRPVLETAAEQMSAALALSAVGAAAVAAAVTPDMRRRRRGTLLFTTGGAAVEPHPDRAVSAVAYAAESAYVCLLHEALAPEGVHVAQVTVVGAIGAGLTHEPEAVAEHLWQRHLRRDAPLVVLRE